MRKVLKSILSVFLLSFTIFIASCSNENIILGFDNNSGVSYIWYHDVKLGLKCKNNASKEQQIALFYGFSKRIINGINWEKWDKSDFNQMIKFSLYRNNIKYSDLGNTDNEKEIYSFNNTLGYFLSDDFLFEKSYYTDVINKDDLIDDEKETMLIYTYKLTPIEDEFIQLAYTAKNDYTYYNGVNEEEIKAGDMVGPDSSHNLFTKFSSVERHLFYKIKDDDISFYTYGDRK